MNFFTTTTTIEKIEGVKVAREVEAGKGSSKLISRVKTYRVCSIGNGKMVLLAKFVRSISLLATLSSFLLTSPTEWRIKKTNKIRFHFSPRFVVGRFTATKRVLPYWKCGNW